MYLKSSSEEAAITSRTSRRHSRQLELWGGVECSVVRVGDTYRNQARETGHAERLSDLDQVAALGIRTMRYPVVWETVAPERPDELDWRWTDERLAHLRGLGVRVIAGLVHHGSGPRYTSLLDPLFPEKLADYAARVAERYPWIDLWTPVNEPLTTGRFSCLYGHWYPHRSDYDAFLQAVVNQCRAVALAMAAIRKVNPAAKLVQTEDLGRVFSTERLAYQAEHENERRWLSLDLLTGRIGPDHGWYRLLLKHGVTEAQLSELRDGLGMPDIVGINHYLTSDRFLDDRVDLYPHLRPGGNGRDIYVDVEAVRVPEPDGQLGPEARLREAWERYRLPVAVTEAHNSCTREEQLRWFMEVWDAAAKLKREGADIRAVTLWSIFGAVDWCSLLTRFEGVQELGLFDFRGDAPRRTLVASAAAELADKGEFRHPVLATPGWWRRHDRFVRAPAILSGRPAVHAGDPILITGASGTLGRTFARVCELRGLRHVLTSRAELDIADPASIERALEQHQPWAIINTAGFVRVPEAEQARSLCFRENANGPELLAKACAVHELPFVTFSSDLVFDGLAGRPYVEHDAACPTCVYGASKHEAERLVLTAWPRSLVVRTSAFFGPWDRYNFVWNTLHALTRGQSVAAQDRQIVSPTYVPDLVNATLDLLLDGEQDLWHLANPGQISWYELAREAALRAKLDPALVMRAGGDAPDRNNALSSARGLLLRPLENAMSAYFSEAAESWAREQAPGAISAPCILKGEDVGVN